MAYVLEKESKDNVFRPHQNPPIYTIPKQKRAVVSVPVHFIQKSFRGFRVRKSIDKVLELNRAVDDVERGVAADDLILRNDDKERLKVNEALMSLLFKLDAITAVDDGVRVCRKNVIRTACLLLERIDSIAKPARSHVLDTPQQVDGKPAQDEYEDDNMEFLDIGQGVGEKQRQGGWLLVKENQDSHDNLMVKLLMEENHKLMKTVAQLCNKTEDQAVLITKLFDRVKQLEVSVQELEDVHLFGSLGINKADKGWRSVLPTAR